MKKLGLAVAAVTIAATAIASIPVGAANYNEKVLKHTPTIDGQIDAAYLESFYIEHEWPSDRDSRSLLGMENLRLPICVDANGNK